jgi:hypothetical protein
VEGNYCYQLLFNTDMTAHDNNVWSNNYLFIFMGRNGFLVKERESREDILSVKTKAKKPDISE